MKRMILVVDDDRTNLMTASKLLSEDYRVSAVNSAELAFKFLQRAIPDLILLDIQMPGMSGFNMMEKLQDDDVLRKIPVIFLTADRSAETEDRCFTLGAMDYISKPFVPTVMKSRIRRTIELEDYRKNLELLVSQQLGRITQIQTDMVFMVAKLIESRDGTTGEHIMRTAKFAGLLAEHARAEGMYPDVLTAEYVDMIIKAAPLHDIGKITVPDAILQKPAALTKEEYDRIKDHAPAGGRIIRENMSSLEEQVFVKIADEMATNHHEKWGGGGYPESLSGEEIPLCARILAIADVFDALLFPRQYKDGMSIDRVFGIMEEERGKIFEPKLLDEFLSLRPELEQMVSSMQSKTAL